MSRVSGIVSVHFSNASDLFPGSRDNRVSIDDFTAPVSVVLDKIWAIKGTDPTSIGQFELLVFLTDAHGTIVFDPERLDELRPRSLKKDGNVPNYGQIEVTAIKLSEEKQKARDAAAEEEELLHSMEEAPIMAMNSASAAAAAAAGSASNPAAVEDPKRADMKRKATLCGLTLPLSRKKGPDVANQENNGKCLLCRSAPIRRSPADAAKLGPRAACCGAASQCRKKSCDACYQYCFSMMCYAKQCPVCGGANRTATGGAALSATTSSSGSKSNITKHSSGINNGSAAADEEEEVEGSGNSQPSAPVLRSSKAKSVISVPPQRQQQQQQQQQHTKLGDEEEDVVVNDAPMKFRRVDE